MSDEIKVHVRPGVKLSKFVIDEIKKAAAQVDSDIDDDIDFGSPDEDVDGGGGTKTRPERP